MSAQLPEITLIIADTYQFEKKNSIMLQNGEMRVLDKSSDIVSSRERVIDKSLKMHTQRMARIQNREINGKRQNLYCTLC